MCSCRLLRINPRAARAWCPWWRRTAGQVDQPKRHQWIMPCFPSGEKTQVKAVSRVRGTARPVAANRQVGAMRGSGATGWIMRTEGNLSYFR
jgi:hypothetical protein